MQKIKTKNFSLQLALNSGQLFNWHEYNGTYYVPQAGKLLKLRQADGAFQYAVFDAEGRRAPNAQAEKHIRNLFQPGRDFAGEVKRFDGDACIEQSIAACPGLTITRQDAFECLLSFILTQNSNIPRIRKNLMDLSANYGQKVVANGREFTLFPTPQQLSTASVREFEKLGLGYRAAYVSSLSKNIAENGFDLKAVGRLNYLDAREKLTELDGVGVKVADCVLLFGYGFEEAFPVDTWLSQIMLKHYNRQLKGHLKRVGSRAARPGEGHIGDFAREKFGQKAGIVHEYLFANRQNLA